MSHVMISFMITTQDKILSLARLSHISQNLKKKGKKIVHAHGVFDLIHPGHIYHFASAKKLGDILIVTITADKFVKKGPGRPVFKQDLRAEVLAALTNVDYVAIVNSDSALLAIQAIKPNFYVKGPDYKNRKPNPNIPRKLGVEQSTVEKFGGKLIFTEDEIIFSSSHLLNVHFNTYPKVTEQYLKKFRQTYTNDHILDLLLTLKDKKILVLGDTILDEYQYTRPLGKSSKEPVLVHIYKHHELFAGGTLATANHLAALSNSVSLVTLLGKKRSFEPFIRKHLRSQIAPRFFYERGAQTIIDRRFLDAYTQQKLFQVRYMSDEIITKQVETKILQYLKKELPLYDAVIVNDYGHGLLTAKIIRLLCKQARFLALNVQANSANFGFNVVTKYPRADFVCMDEQEVRLATHDKFSDLVKLAKRIARKLSCLELIVTRGPFGSISVTQKNGAVHSPSLATSIVDRVGAGDAFFAIAAAAASIGADHELVSFLGNVAGALKLQTVGNKVPIDFKEMCKFITRLLK